MCTFKAFQVSLSMYKTSRLLNYIEIRIELVEILTGECCHLIIIINKSGT